MSGYLSITPWQYTPSFLGYAEVTKDGRGKMSLKLGKEGDYVVRWLKAHVGSLVTIYVPPLGVAWTPTLSYNKRWKFLYVRVPAKLKALFEPIWLASYPIPVIISIPPIPTTPLKDGVRPLGETPRAHQGGINRGASAGLGGQAPQSGQEG